MLAAVALCEAIERLLGLEPAIKWPNDVVLDGQKAAASWPRRPTTAASRR